MAERTSEFAYSPSKLVSELVGASKIPHDRHLTIQGESLQIIAGSASREMAWNKIRKEFATQKANGSDVVQSASAALNNPELSFAELVIGLAESSREMQLRLPDAEIRWALWSKALPLEFAMIHRREAMLRKRSLPRSEMLGAFSPQDLTNGIAAIRKFRKDIYQSSRSGMPPAARR